MSKDELLLDAEVRTFRDISLCRNYQWSARLSARNFAHQYPTTLANVLDFFLFRMIG